MESRQVVKPNFTTYFLCSSGSGRSGGVHAAKGRTRDVAHLH